MSDGDRIDPLVGSWYRHLDKGQLFQVVGVDEDTGLVELQHYDGDIEEMTLGAWAEATLEPAAAPEDWTGSVDAIERDDLGYSETEMGEGDWRRPLEEIAADETEAWQTATEPGEDDEWAEGAMSEPLLAPEGIENERPETESERHLPEEGSEPEEEEGPWK